MVSTLTSLRIFHADSLSGSTEASQKRERIIKRAAQELKDGMYVNLGIGMPLAAPAFLPEGTEIILESENGILGMGRYPKPGEEGVYSSL